MAEKNIQMQRKTATGYDKYYPKTKAELVEFADGTTVEAHKADAVKHITSADSLPTPSSTYRGKIYILLGGTGVGDYPFVCLKKSDGSYTWVNLFTAMYSSST